MQWILALHPGRQVASCLLDFQVACPVEPPLPGNEAAVRKQGEGTVSWLSVEEEQGLAVDRNVEESQPARHHCRSLGIHSATGVGVLQVDRQDLLSATKRERRPRTERRDHPNHLANGIEKVPVEVGLGS